MSVSELSGETNVSPRRYSKPLLVNLYGGPGSGKSTMAAKVFGELKEGGYNAELVTEFAKDLTWEQRHFTLQNQLYIFAKQHHRLWRVSTDADIIVTDSPLLLSLVYGSPTGAFRDLVLEKYTDWQNFNIFLQRVKEYNPKGRSQTLEQAKEIDDVIRTSIANVGIPFDMVTQGNAYSLKGIISRIQMLRGK